MGQRAVQTSSGPRDKVLADVIACEEKYDAHLVQPQSWPPRHVGAGTGEPCVMLPCVRCGTNCLTYAGHATGEMKGIEVVLPAETPQRGGRPKVA